MTTITCAAVWLLFPLIVLIGVVYWITEGRGQRIRRWRKQGQSWAAIGRRLGCAPSTAKRWSMA
jgi:hypothetical protein